MCPVCTVAVGVGLGLSRWFRIDDAISGLWIGALIISLSFVLAKFTRKYILLSQNKIILAYILLFLITTILPLWYFQIIGNPLNRIYGIDKLIFGTALGMVVFFLSLLFHESLKVKNCHKSYFPFQKVVVPVLTLTVISIILYLLII